MNAGDGPQLDLSAHVSRVRSRTRPWRSIIALVLAIGAAVTSRWAHSGFPHFFTGNQVPDQIIAGTMALAFCLFGSAATISLSSKAHEILQPVIGPSHAAVARYALLLVGAVTTLVITLTLFDIPVGQLVLGGALTSVFVGIAAQQALGNVFAGLVVQLARPFRVGDAINLQAGALGGPLEGTVTEIGITYVRLSTDSGMLSIPNSQVLNAVIGPRQPRPPQPPPAAQPGQAP